MNLFAPGDRALVLTSGHFGRSWAATASATRPRMYSGCSSAVSMTAWVRKLMVKADTSFCSSPASAVFVSR